MKVFIMNLNYPSQSRVSELSVAVRFYETANEEDYPLFTITDIGAKRYKLQGQISVLELNVLYERILQSEKKKKDE